MVQMMNAKERAEFNFKQLEGFWGSEVPEVLGSWSGKDLAYWIEDNRAIPFDQYADLKELIEQNHLVEYKERLAKLDRMITRYKPKLFELFGVSLPE